MKQLWALVLLVITHHPIYSQEVKHAPTVEQCRADQRLWMSKVEQPPVLANFKELISWDHEMDDCLTVDHDRWAEYHNTASEIAYEKLLRLTKFVERHNLYVQFLAEDAQGKR